MKLVRVNMATKVVTVEEMPQAYVGLGGRGLSAAIISSEVPANCHPLGPENKLVFAPGLLTGTELINTSRISIGAKSPLTGGIKESNAGGNVPAALGRLGIGALVVEKKAPEGELFVLRINRKGDVNLTPGQRFKGMRTYALARSLVEKYGEKTGVLCIGPAGELQLSAASIQSTDVDGRPCRAAGRGGLGAVMGSKGLKALAVDQPTKSPQAFGDLETFREAAKIYAKAVKDHPFSGRVLGALGTAVLVAPINGAGAFPSYNATKGVFDGWEKISGERLVETMKKRGGNPSHMGCSQCIIHCSNEFVDRDGQFVTSSLEYETLWSMGGMTGIDDLDTIGRLDFLCDDIGVDTMSVGVAIAVAMDAGYRKFGDGQGAIEMVEEIERGTELGKIIGNGPAAVGKHFGHKRVPAVKGQSIAAYDPRAIQGMAVTYATSPMGADHTAGWVINENLSAFGGKLNPLGREGQVEVSRQAQIHTAFFDCTGLCQFAGGPARRTPEAKEALLRMINIKLGTKLTPDDLLHMGVRVLRMEREFNQKAGFTNKDDRLAKFFYEEPLPPHNTVVVISDEEMDQTLDL